MTLFCLLFLIWVCPGILIGVGAASLSREFYPGASSLRRAAYGALNGLVWPAGLQSIFDFDISLRARGRWRRGARRGR